VLSGPSGRFIGYPTDHLLAAFRDPADATAAAAALRAQDVPAGEVTVLRGAEGADRLDGTGAAHGLFTRLRRLVSFTLMDQLPDMAWYERSVRDGGAVVMVRVRGDAAKAAAVDVLRRRDGHFINYYGRFATEEIDRWSGPEPAVHDLLKR
jgi:hypothetical protein